MRIITETITTTVYKFDELSDSAKEKFTGEQRNLAAEFLADEMYDCLKSAMKTMNISIDDYEIGIDGSGYINLSVDDDAEELEGVRAYKWIVNNCFSDVDKKKMYWQKNVDIRSCKSLTSSIESKDWMDNCPFSGIIYDYAVKDAWDYWCAELKSGFGPSVRDFLDELESQYLKKLSDGYYGFNEEDARELAEANDYEFLEDGTIY